MRAFGVVADALGCALHARCHVFHGDQYIDLEIGRLHLLIGRGGIEAVAEIVVLRRRVLLQLAARHVMIGEQQAIGADERARSAVVEADAREAQMIEPRLSRNEVVFSFSNFKRRVVEGPHAFFGMEQGQCGQEKRGRKQNDGAKDSSWHMIPQSGLAIRISS